MRKKTNLGVISGYGLIKSKLVIKSFMKLFQTSNILFKSEYIRSELVNTNRKEVIQFFESVLLI